MVKKADEGIVDSLTLRFTGENEDGSQLHELRASHVAEVLTGLVGLSGDFAKAGAFNSEGIVDSEVLVRPAQEGSFLIEVVRVVTENWEAISTVAGPPTLTQIILWATKSARADVEEFEHLGNGNVKVKWQDGTAQEVPLAAWKELQKNTPRRKRQLRQILAPLSDSRVSAVDVERPSSKELEKLTPDDAPDVFVLTKPDYDTVKPDDKTDERSEIVNAEAQMTAIDFDDSTKWRVRATFDGKTLKRSATVEDEDFLGHVSNGLAIRKEDIFQIRLRVDTSTTNGRTSTRWTVLEVLQHRRASGDDD
ncbi:hypothetical protein CMMCAS08_15395 [Clavibacter michiganensis subsp. michiganensis]|uniref:hypothetical protein n=1 Tax=Clavibacter michiganensis TaxID=28447 RepID=UPI000B67D26C|nr:hypothetical protein [Clavibacter michiganensis]OUE00138.1 hypothetical protein CMMCAS06_00275 [Clavibacter michiganensis subsp. michiganensis]OUE02272.1 hypothetical protein CMMCAS08_15395 [Clavibacter michiganensis subsp. michiganensis]